jgi:hypothetical protein
MSKVKLNAESIVNAIFVIHQDYMPPDHDVTVPARSTAKTENHILGRRSAHFPHVSIENVSGLKSIGVVVVPSAVCFKDLIVMMLVIINLCVLTLFLLELAIFLLALTVIFPSLMVLATHALPKSPANPVPTCANGNITQRYNLEYRDDEEASR